MIIVIRCTSILLMTVIVVMVSSESDNYNEKEFKQLCNILRVAEGEPKKIPDELAKFSETRNVLEKLLRVTRTSTSTYQKVVQLKSSDKEDADFKSYTVKRKTANAKIQHAMEKTNEIFSRIEEELIQANKERMLARNSLAHAIYGVQVGELPKEKDIPDVLKNVSRGSISNHHGGEKKVKYHDTSKEPACGGAGESGAGFTLINDFYCLCVGKDNEKAVCHDKIRGPGKWEPEECKDCKDCCKDMSCCCCCGDNCNKCKCEKCNCRSGCSCGNGQCQKCVLTGTWMKLTNQDGVELELHDGWPHIRNVCSEALKGNINTDSASILEVLQEFNRLLGNNSRGGIETNKVEMDSRRLFVLGHAKAIKKDNGCNGKIDGVCVNYWAVSNLGIGIMWQNYMLEAQKHLQAMDKHIKKAQKLSTMFKKLKESAEESHRSSAHGSMLWPIEEGSQRNTLHDFFIFFACLL